MGSSRVPDLCQAHSLVLAVMSGPTVLSHKGRSKVNNNRTTTINRQTKIGNSQNHAKCTQPHLFYKRSKCFVYRDYRKVINFFVASEIGKYRKCKICYNSQKIFHPGPALVESLCAVQQTWQRANASFTFFSIFLTIAAPTHSKSETHTHRTLFWQFWDVLINDYVRFCNLARLAINFGWLRCWKS